MNTSAKIGMPRGLPTELQSLLDKDKMASLVFESLSNSRQKAYCQWIDSGKQEATRKRRAEKSIAMLLKNHNRQPDKACPSLGI